METVEDGDGRRYVRLKRSSASSLVHDPERGTTTHVANTDLEPVGGEPPLETAAAAIPGPVRALITAVPNDRALGLLVVLEDQGGLDARTLLDRTACCESDLFATLRALATAELIKRAGDESWELTERGAAALETLRQS